ncbi:MAG: hypothetical protein ACRDGT_02355 [Candidatus Limnocylindria bacterium]
MTTSLRVLRYGRDGPPQTFTALRAGPLTLIFDPQAGDLRHIRLGEREVLRRVHVAVRGEGFRTIPGRVTDVDVTRRAGGFAISLGCEHRDGELDFRWRGRLSGDERGRVRFVMDGRAHAAFLADRIGICVLHPAEECAGAPFTVVHVDGSEERLLFPRYIAPHQPATDVGAIRHDVTPGCAAEVRFEGEIFEMEDQRNWTDASYKTYSTPLRLPRPMTFERGAAVLQSVELTLECDAPRSTARGSGGSEAVALTVGEPTSVRPPLLGLGLPHDGRSPSDSEVELLRALGLAHLRADLHLRDPRCGSALRSAAHASAALGAPLEVAVFVTNEAEEQLQRLSALVDETRPSVRTWLVFHEDEAAATARWVMLARAYLGGAAPTAMFGAGTDRYFTQINRSHPPVEALDVLCYPLNPQVHASDDLSLVENLAGQAMTVESAHRIAGALPLAVTPVTLRSRSWRSEAPNTADPRLSSLFGAAWTVGSLKYLAESDVQSATYYETSGGSGVMPAEGAVASGPGGVFPVYHVFAELRAIAGGTVVPMRSSDPLAVVAFAVRKGGRTRLLVANLVPRRSRVFIEGIRGVARVRYLDETNAASAMRAPQLFQDAPRGAIVGVDGRLPLTLLPYAVASVDVEDGGGA